MDRIAARGDSPRFHIPADGANAQFLPPFRRHVRRLGGYDNGSSPYMLGREITGVAVPFAGVAKPADLRAARNEAISYAAYRLLRHRFRNIIMSSEEAQAVFDAQLAALGYDSSITSTHYRSGSPAALGNYIAQGLIEIGLQDGSNEALRHANQIYQLTNVPSTARQWNNRRSQPLATVGGQGVHRSDKRHLRW